VTEKTESKSETKTLEQADTIMWTCPFCGNVNGTDEVTKCQCGAKRKGNEATK
jgi:rubrerythrin